MGGSILPLGGLRGGQALCGVRSFAVCQPGRSCNARQPAKYNQVVAMTR